MICQDCGKEYLNIEEYCGHLESHEEKKK